MIYAPKKIGRLIWHDLWLMPINWITGFWKDMTGPIGYRGVAVVIAAYAGAYAIIESSYERQLNLAMSERYQLITIASSGKRTSFVGAMKSFGPIQNIDAYAEPTLLEPWNWWEKTRPNVQPLLNWARHSLDECRAEDCGTRGKKYRINLNRANLRDAILKGVDLYNSDLRSADLRGADLTESELDASNLFRADLREANLTGAELEGAELKRADLRGANLSGADLAESVLRRATLTGADLTRAFLWRANVTNADLASADLAEADLTEADLRGVKGLTCDKLIAAKEWQRACRDAELACGADIPEPETCK